MNNTGIFQLDVPQITHFLKQQPQIIKRNSVLSINETLYSLLKKALSAQVVSQFV